MKRILITTLSLVLSAFGSWAQVADSISIQDEKVALVADTISIVTSANDKVKANDMDLETRALYAALADSLNKKYGENDCIPITRDQAEELITKMVIDARAPYVKAREEARILTKFKVKTLKNRLLDQALRDSYLDEYKDRLDRMERMMMLMMLSNGGKQLSPAVISAIMGGQNGQPGSNLVQLFQDSTRQQGGSYIPEKMDKKGLYVDEFKLLGDGTSLTDKSMPTGFMSHVFFKVAKSNLSATAKEVLDKVVQWMNEYPAVNVSLTGYASPEGNLKFNNKLSKNRVNAVANYLTSKGINPSRLVVSPKGIDSMTEPLPEARRVDIKPILCND